MPSRATPALSVRRVVRVNVKLDDELHRRARSEGVMAGLTLQDTVATYLAVFASLGHELHRRAVAAAEAEGLELGEWMRRAVASALGEDDSP
jgi:predicted HicB family RNase H-like nuclease